MAPDDPHHRIGMYKTQSRLVSVLALFVAAGTAVCVEASAESVLIDGGLVADVVPDEAGVRAFKGIPYAAPPVGKLRWRPPQARSWLAIPSELGRLYP